ncbi:unnamed protein product [Caenorhabditis nigoni]
MGQIESIEWKPLVENIVHGTQDRNVNLNNAQKADWLKNAFEDLFENLQLYVVVFNDCDNGPKFSYFDNEVQMVVSLKRGSCNIIVYHSKEWGGACQNSRNQFIEQVESCKSGVIPWWQDYRGFPNILKNDHVPNAGFVTLIRDDQDVQVRCINCEGGPGKWIKALNEAGEEFDLIVGYK